MPSYVFEWSVDRGEPDPACRTSLFPNRVYKEDRRAIAAALIMFRNRTTDGNDELSVHKGRVNGWGGIEGRFLGKVAYNPLGTAYSFLKADKCPRPDRHRNPRPSDSL